MIDPAIHNIELPIGTDFTETYSITADEGDLTGRTYAVKVMKKSDKKALLSLTSSLNTGTRNWTISYTDTQSLAFVDYINLPCYWIAYYTTSGSLIYPVWSGDVTFQDFRDLT